MDETIALFGSEQAQAGVDALSVSTVIHPAEAFAPDGRPLFGAHMRNLPSSVIRGAVFSIAIGGGEDRRAPHETTVGGCEGAKCAIKEKGPTL